jgi:TonB family protein
VAFIQKNLVFPETAIENNIQGKCFLRFVVSINGTISNVTVTKGVPDCPECDKAAIKAIKAMPKWKPGILNGRSVSSYCSIPINFATEINTQVKKKNKQIEAVKPLPILQIENTTISKSVGCEVKVGFGGDSHFAGTEYVVIGGRIVDTNYPFNGNYIPGACVSKISIGTKVGVEVFYTRNGVRSAEPAVGLLMVQ